MVLDDCEECMNYWFSHGSNLEGYEYLRSNRHIPNAHPAAMCHTSSTSSSHPSQQADHSDSTSTTTPLDQHDQTFKPSFVVRPDISGKGTMTYLKKYDNLKGEYKCQLCKFYLTYSGERDRHFLYGMGMFDRGEHIPDAHWRELVNVEIPIDNQQEHAIQIGPENDLPWRLDMYRAATNGDWELGKYIIHMSSNIAKTSRIRRNAETALHVAVGSGPRAIKFVEELLKLLTPSDVEMKNTDGHTALGIAAKVGNLKAAKLLVDKNPDLPNISSGGCGGFPIHCAAEYGHKKLLLFLLEVTTNRAYLNPMGRYAYGKKFLYDILKAEFYDVAILLMGNNTDAHKWGATKGLILMAGNPSAFSFGRDRSFLRWLVEKCEPESVNGMNNYFGGRLLSSSLWTLFSRQVPHLKHTVERLLKYRQAMELLSWFRLGDTIDLDGFTTLSSITRFKLPLLLAAANGIHEIIEEVAKSFPDAVWFYDDNSSDIFRLAISNRHHNVYNLLYEMGDLCINTVRQSVDEKGDNMLHWAAYLAPPQRLNLISGAASQMQYEVQWYKEIENLVPVRFRNLRNLAGLTPRDVFLQSHQQLMVEAEKWMKDTANSCTVSAALITTIVFAAAITVPGGNSGENGIPMFATNKAFIIFGVADALSLFTSSISILMFLSILTSRYAEQDFLFALPKRLIIGLLTLFVSISSMMVAFSATLYLVFGAHKLWILTSVVASSCLPVAIFASLQFSLLFEMISSTYGSGMFGSRRKTSFSLTDDTCENELRRLHNSYVWFRQHSVTVRS